MTMFAEKVIPAIEKLPFELKQRRRQVLYLSLIALGALVLSAFCLKLAPIPFVWIGLIWGVALFAGMFCLRGTWPRIVLFNCGLVALMLAAAEAYFPPAATPPTYSEGYSVSDDFLGSRPVAGTTGHSRRFEKGKLLYDVTYTIGSNGLRIAPPARQDNAPCIAFFGCSFTFGEGLEDFETLPYQVGSQSGGTYRTFNFGFHGYGPQQMLATIERGRLNQIADCKPKIAIYQAIAQHVLRVAGKVPFARHSPRYVLDPNGVVHFAGHFDDADAPRPPLSARIGWHLGRSAIYRMLRQPRVSRNDLQLMFATVQRSRDLLRVDYPEIKFYVILWPVTREDRDLYREVQDGFRALHMPVHYVEDILPGFKVDRSKYLLSISDGHPNAAANRILANYVLTKLVEQPIQSSRRGNGE